ncbi:MAG: hypothetical protein NTV54_01585 [Ignavibacteriales bacterium]|nr:hypothetical protein [Ignavibacteriales bacterium]
MPKNAENLSSYFITAQTPHPAIIGLFLFAANYFRYQILFLPFISTPVIYGALAISVGAIFLYEIEEGRKNRTAPVAYTQARTSLSVSLISVVFLLFIQLAMMFYLLNSFLEVSLHGESFGIMLGIVVVSGVTSVVGGFSWMARLCAMLGIVIIGGTLFSTFGPGHETVAAFNQQMTPKVHASIVLQWIGGCIGLPLVSLWMWRVDTALLPRSSKTIFGPSAAAASLLVALSIWRNVPLLLYTGSVEQKSAGVIAAIAIAAAGIAGTSWNASSSFALWILGKKMSESKRALAGRLAAAVVVIVSIAFIQVVRAIDAEIVPIYVTALACFVPPVVALFVVRTFITQVPVHSVRWSLIGGEVFALAFFAGIRTGVMNDAFVAAPAVFAATIAIYGIANMKSVRASRKELSSSNPISAKSLFIQ